jgi:hypothetical protein
VRSSLESLYLLVVKNMKIPKIYSRDYNSPSLDITESEYSETSITFPTLNVSIIYVHYMLICFKKIIFYVLLPCSLRYCNVYC